jgi:ATP-binding cassette subfamily B protein
VTSHKNQNSKQPSSKNIRALSAIWPFLKNYIGLMSLALTVLVLTASISLVLPLAVRKVIDEFGVQSTGLLDQHFTLALIVVALLAVGTGVRYYLVTRLGERVVADIRALVFKNTIGMSPSFFERILTGEVLSRITTDTTLILSVIGSSISVALRNVLLFFGGILMMLITSNKLTALALLIVPLIIIPIIFLGKKLRTLSRENQDHIAASSGNASEAFLGVQTVQAFTNENLAIRSFSNLTEESYRVALKRISIRALMTVIVIFLIFAGIIGVLWVGARDVQNGTTSAGELIQFLIYAIMVGGSVAALSEIWGELQRAAGATERLAELLNTRDCITDPVQPKILTNIKGKIQFKDVGFSYPTRPDGVALKGISLLVNPGETIALVGPSGAGKSTILQLILRFYDPLSGEILIDDVSLRDLKREDFRKEIALVPQDPIIFATTVMENIKFGRPDSTEEEIKEAARSASAADFIEQLPQGYSTYVGERGMMLSGGQKQRIAIARAILRNAPILLLDEATSALDSENEVAVQAAVDELSREKTTLVIAHRLSTVQRADRIIVFDNGGLVAEGTHKSLIAQNGLYARLAHLQFGV